VFKSTCVVKVFLLRLGFDLLSGVIPDNSKTFYLINYDELSRLADTGASSLHYSAAGKVQRSRKLRPTVGTKKNAEYFYPAFLF
jgi:hypothetical protein